MLMAAVEVRGLGQALVMTVVNISAGGAQIATEGQDVSGMRTGEVYDFVVFDGEDTSRQAAASGRLVRRSDDAIGVSWSDEDGSIWKIGDLLAQLGTYP
jgi:hypothetical protein